MFAQKMVGVAIVLTVAMLCSPGSANAQRRGLMIGGPNGLIIGGGNGFRAGGTNGLIIGGGNGFRAGGARGVQFGGRYRYAYPVQGVAPTYYSNALPSQATSIANNPQANKTTPTMRAPTMRAPTAAKNSDQRVERAASGMISLRYPDTANRPLNYTINGTPFQLAPGNSIQMQSGQNWQIGIVGNKRQPQTFTLRNPGDYQLQQSESGWIIDSEQAVRVVETPSTLPTPAKRENISKPGPGASSEQSNSESSEKEMRSILELKK